MVLFSAAPSLRELYQEVVDAQEEAMEKRLERIIRASNPEVSICILNRSISQRTKSGTYSNPLFFQKLAPLVKGIGEYESYKADPAANFVHDSAGHAIFRQYRRMNLNAVRFLMVTVAFSGLP